MNDDRTRVSGSLGTSAGDGGQTRVGSMPGTPLGSASPSAGPETEAFGVAQRAAPPPVQVGEVLGHTYRVEAFLAKGGMGAVYRARHVVLESEHAIKIILAELSQDPQVIALLSQEAKTLRTVKNDAVVEYQGLNVDEHGRRYLVMEFVDGPSLASVLRDRRFTPAEVRTLRERLALGLAAAHDKGIFHRDISPDNIILPGERVENAKIIDFGIAKSTATGEKTIIGGDFAGKFSYASPEQAGMHGGKVDARSDIYSLGLVLASAAIGYGGKLDMGSSLSSVFEARQKVPDLSQVPAELRNEIAAMLQPMPADRLQSMQEVVALDAKGARGGRNTASRGASAPSAAAPRQRASARVMTAAALSFAVVVAVGAAYFLLSPPKPQPELVKVEPPPQPTPAPENKVLPPSPAPPTPSPVPAPLPAPLPPKEAGPDFEGRLRAAIQGYSCADLKATRTADGGFKLDGFVSSPADLATLRNKIGAIALPQPVVYAVAVYIRPHCEVAKLLNDTAMPAAALPPARLDFNQPNLVYREGDALIVTATARQDGYLYVDLYDNEGNVAHALPQKEHPTNRMQVDQSITLGSKKDAPGKRRVYEIQPPFGPWMVTAISSPKPLFLSERGEVENADAYLADLARALRAAGQSGAGPVATFTLIDTVPR
jgi:eukaryotic-like serine/threonine-protein kinase